MPRTVASASQEPGSRAPPCSTCLNPASVRADSSSGEGGEERRVQGQGGVGREIGDRQHRPPGIQVDRLGADDDDRGAVLAQSLQRVEQDPPGFDVLRLRGWLVAHLQSQPAEARSCSRQDPSFVTIHSSSASPSWGIRPLPVRQSTTTWEGAA